MAEPSAGSAIFTNGATYLQRVDYRNVTVDGFYDNIDVGVGSSWSMIACTNKGPVRYGLRVRNTVNADWGDWTVAGCGFWAGTTAGPR